MALYYAGDLIQVRNLFPVLRPSELGYSNSGTSVNSLVTWSVDFG